MRVLFTTPILEHPAAGGPQLRIENSIKALSRICDLYVVARTPAFTIGGVGSLQFYRDHCREFSIAPSSAGLSSNRYLRAFQTRYRRYFHSEADVDLILQTIERNGIRILWFGFGNISMPLIRSIKRRRPELKMICDTDSVWSRFVLRELPYETDARRSAEIEKQGREKEQEEREWVDLCDVTTAVSPVDADYYRSIATYPDRVMLFSNVIDMDAYRTSASPPPDFHRPCIYLAGTFGHVHSPMDRAARWVLEEILPKVRARIPDVHFYIVGRGTERTLRSVTDPNVTVMGKLPSVLPYLCNADVALVPLQFESGTRFKILEAGACGVPIVSTTLGAEGIPVRHGTHVLLADDAASFSDAIVKLISDRQFASSLAAGCRRLIEDRYGLRQLEREGNAILQKVAS